MTVALRLARWHGRAEFRSRWRRPPYPGVASLLLTLTMLAGLLWLSAHRDLLGPFSASPVLALTGALARLVLGIHQGAQVLRRNLLANSLLPVVYGSPQPPGRWLGATLLFGALKELGGALWAPLAIALLGREPLALRLAVWAPAAFLAGAAAGMLGLLLGALAMVWLARRWPRDLSFAILLLQLLQIGTGIWVVLTAARGDSPGLLARLLFGLPALALGLPGLWMALLALVRRLDPGQACHEAWLALREHAGQSGPVRSARLPLPAVAARDLLALWRNPVGRYRAVVAGLVLVAAPLQGRWLGHRPASWLAAAPLLLWLLIASEWLAAAFSGEGGALSWYRLAPIRPVRVLAGKWLALVALPAVYAGAVAGALAAGAGRPVVPLALMALATCLGAGSVQLGLTACSATPAPAWTGQDSQLAAWVGEQVARTPGAFAGYALAWVYLAAAAWHRLPRLAVLAAPLAALIMGAWRLRAALMPRFR